mmetsp:Transcript_19739/g.25508  ORF Transcript_19739/g.25508 Transcript_19739/m.25508 type:complete len:853 (-) Transcript_19739:63-2621(-)
MDALYQPQEEKANDLVDTQSSSSLSQVLFTRSVSGYHSVELVVDDLQASEENVQLSHDQLDERPHSVLENPIPEDQQFGDDLDKDLEAEIVEYDARGKEEEGADDPKVDTCSSTTDSALEDSPASDYTTPKKKNPMRRQSAGILSPDLRMTLYDEFNKVEEVNKHTLLGEEYERMIDDWELDAISSDDGLTNEEHHLWEHSKFLRDQMVLADKENMRKERQQLLGRTASMRGGILKGGMRKRMDSTVQTISESTHGHESTPRRGSTVRKFGRTNNSSPMPNIKHLQLDISDLTVILPGANQQVVQELEQAIKNDPALKSQVSMDFHRASSMGSEGFEVADPNSEEGMSLMNRFVELQEWAEGSRLDDSMESLNTDYSGIVGMEQVGISKKNAVIVYTSQMIVRPDAPHNAILLNLEQSLIDLGMQVERPHESGIVAEGFWGAGDKPQRWVDLQLGIEKVIKQRVVLLRFCRRWTYSGEFMSGFSGSKADEYKRKNRNWARDVLDVAWAGLEEAGLTLGQLRSQRIIDCPVESLDVLNLQILDKQFKEQLEGLCREEMSFSLQQASENIDEYVAAAEHMASCLLILMEPMYAKYGLDAPPLPEELPLSCYPMDLLNHDLSRSESNEEWFGNSRVDIGSWRPLNELEKMNWVVEMAYNYFASKCSKEMGVRIQRKNLQAMDRLSKLHKFERTLVKILRDAEEVHNSAVSVDFNEKVQVFVASMASDKECPIFDCKCDINKSPGTMYVTYWHIWVVSSLAGGAGRWVLKIDYTDIEQIEVQKKRFSLSRSSLNIVTSTQGHITLSPKVESCTKLSYLIELLVRLHSEPEDALEFPSNKMVTQPVNSHVTDAINSI